MADGESNIVNAARRDYRSVSDDDLLLETRLARMGLFSLSHVNDIPEGTSEDEIRRYVDDLIQAGIDYRKVPDILTRGRSPDECASLQSQLIEFRRMKAELRARGYSESDISRWDFRKP